MSISSLTVASVLLKLLNAADCQQCLVAVSCYPLTVLPLYKKIKNKSQAVVKHHFSCHTMSLKLVPNMFFSTFFHTVFVSDSDFFCLPPQYATYFLFCFSKSWKRPWAWINTMNLFFKSKTDRFKLSDRHEMNQSDQLKRGIGRLSMRGGAFHGDGKDTNGWNVPGFEMPGSVYPLKNNNGHKLRGVCGIRHHFIALSEQGGQHLWGWSTQKGPAKTKATINIIGS